MPWSSPLSAAKPVMWASERSLSSLLGFRGRTQDLDAAARLFNRCNGALRGVIDLEGKLGRELLLADEADTALFQLGDDAGGKKRRSGDRCLGVELLRV